MSHEGVTLSFRILSGIGYSIGVLDLSDRMWRTLNVRHSEPGLPSELMTTRRVAIPADCDPGDDWWTKELSDLSGAPRVSLADLRHLLDDCSHAALHSVFMRPHGTMGIVRATHVESFAGDGRIDRVCFSDASKAAHILECVFPAFHQWRWKDKDLEPEEQTRHDMDVVAELNDMETYFVVAKLGATPSSPWAITGIWGLRKVLTTDVKPLRRLLRWTEAQKPPEPAGVRICWHCGRVTAAYVDRTSNRHTIRCGDCNYPIGKSRAY